MVYPRLFALLMCLICLLTNSLVSTQEDWFQEKLRIGRGDIQDVEWHPGGDMLLVDTVIGAWLYTDTLEDITHIEDARLATFSPDGRLLAGVDSQNNLTLWDKTTFELVRRLPAHADYVTALEWSPDGTKLASVGDDGYMLLWDTTSWEVSTKF